MLYVYGSALTLVPICLRPGEYRDLVFPYHDDGLFLSLSAPPLPGLAIEWLRCGTRNLVVQQGDLVPLDHGIVWRFDPPYPVIPDLPPSIRLRAVELGDPLAEVWARGITAGFGPPPRAPRFLTVSGRV